jgi:hypothetical protein
MGCPVHALTAYAHDAAAVLAQEEIGDHTDMVEAESTVAPRLIPDSPGAGVS